MIPGVRHYIKQRDGEQDLDSLYNFADATSSLGLESVFDLAYGWDFRHGSTSGSCLVASFLFTNLTARYLHDFLTLMCTIMDLESTSSLLLSEQEGYAWMVPIGQHCYDGMGVVLIAKDIPRYVLALLALAVLDFFALQGQLLILYLLHLASSIFSQPALTW